MSGRTALVTGAGRGIGAAVSSALCRAGASVVLAARDGQPLEALAAHISAAGGQAVAVPTDLTDPRSVRRLAEQILGAFGRLDAAVNHGAVDVVALAMTYEIPSMRHGGCIVNLAPTAGAHAAMAEVTCKVALDVADSGIRISAVAAAGEEDIANAVVRNIARRLPLGR
ncbi:SDR family NAD(P)-dependent oxidoreductase [Nonomuraea polychroma]|uniref:SDR family NAD(P)-dependent oxidoreductase n=1 Tax=Nonomuraea polychroma TaxID=46176 RepID=UPI003D8EDFC6